MTGSQDTRRFAEIPFLANLDEPALDALAFASETRILRRGERLFGRGEPGDCAYLLISGRLRLSDVHPEAAAGTIIGPGSLIAEMALLVPTERRQTATALDASAVLLIHRDVFLRVLKTSPGSAARLRDFCARRLAEFTGALGTATRALGEDPAA